MGHSSQNTITFHKHFETLRRSWGGWRLFSPSILWGEIPRRKGTIVFKIIVTVWIWWFLDKLFFLMKYLPSRGGLFDPPPCSPLSLLKNARQVYGKILKKRLGGIAQFSTNKKVFGVIYIFQLINFFPVVLKRVGSVMQSAKSNNTKERWTKFNNQGTVGQRYCWLMLQYNKYCQV